MKYRTSIASRNAPINTSNVDLCVWNINEMNEYVLNGSEARTFIKYSKQMNKSQFIANDSLACAPKMKRIIYCCFPLLGAL